mmetsp:Transcript_7161/g.15800  ORF Transcript_7161/g.15800 Transcript_7161/m.15800 type:complete len:677 (-) Transcript_7161:183-2213(-)
MALPKTRNLMNQDDDQRAGTAPPANYASAPGQPNDAVAPVAPAPAPVPIGQVPQPQASTVSDSFFEKELGQKPMPVMVQQQQPTPVPVAQQQLLAQQQLAQQQLAQQQQFSTAGSSNLHSAAFVTQSGTGLQMTPNVPRQTLELPTKSPLLEQKNEKQQELMRLMQEVQRLQQESEEMETLQREEEAKRRQEEAEVMAQLQKMERDAAELKRKLGRPLTDHESSLLASDPSEYNNTQRIDSLFPPPPYSPASNHSSESGYSSAYSAPRSFSGLSRLRLKLSNMLKPKSPDKKRGPDLARDVESQSKKYDDVPSALRRRGKKIEQSPQSPPRTNPINKLHVPSRKEWGIILKKVAEAIFTDYDDEYLQREDTPTYIIIVTLAKEAILGILIAFFLVSFVLLIDYNFVLGIAPARSLRRATASYLTDAETLKTLEVDAGLKLMPMEDYNSLVDNLQHTVNKTILAKDVLDKRVDDLKKEEEKEQQTNEELIRLKTELDLELFCESCMWSKSQSITCGKRVEALEQAYKAPKYEAMVSAMLKPSCKFDKKTLDQKKKADNLMEYWEKNKGDWCEDCDWEENMSCGARAKFLNERYNMSLDKAKATAMAESNHCTQTYYKEEQQYLAKFCKDCEWGPRSTCQDRVDYLVYTYKNSDRVAKLNAMKKLHPVTNKPVCVIGG